MKPTIFSNSSIVNLSKACLWGLVAVLLPYLALAQPKVEVKDDEAELDGVRRRGMSVWVELDRKLVDKAWVKKLREAGRADISRTGSLTVRPAALPGVPQPATAFARTDQSEKGTRVFLAIDLGTEPMANTHPGWPDLKKYLYDFAISAYRDDLNAQIAEGDKAVDQAVKGHETTVDEGLYVKRQMERNLTEKQRLIRLMKENEVEFFKLKADSTQNKINQQAALDEIQRLRQAVESKKNKLGTLE